MANIGLLVLQPTAFCNIDCRYCYLSDRYDATRMDFAVLQKVVENIFAFGYVADVLPICWHAGEPTALPVAYYETAFAIIDAIRPPSVTVKHIFQTNAVAINDRWCDLFAQHAIAVGVSLDGPRVLHDAQRRDRRGRGTFDATMRGIGVLQRRGIPFHVIAVLTRASLSMPGELYDFFTGNGIKEVSFNVEEQEGQNRTTTLDGPDVEDLFCAFFQEYYRRLKAGGFPHWVREIDDTINRILAANLDRPPDKLTTPLGHTNVDRFGNFSTFCPELLGVSTQQYGTFSFGNLAHQTLDECLTDSRLRQAAEDIQAGVRQCQQTCSYFGLCGGGAPANKHFENGTFVSTETQFCRLRIQRLTDLALGWINEALAQGAPQPSSQG